MVARISAFIDGDTAGIICLIVVGSSMTSKRRSVHMTKNVIAADRVCVALVIVDDDDVQCCFRASKSLQGCRPHRPRSLSCSYYKVYIHRR